MNMNDKNEVCGTCKYHKYDKENKCWYCNNQRAYEYSDYTDYDYECEDWESKDE